jgi:hypothetical protein
MYRSPRGSGGSGMFDIITSRDFLEKLEADFDDFMKEPYSARHALNCAITAYHLHEWVWGDWLKTDYATWKTLGIRDKDSFLAWIDKACIWFKTIQDLANGAKQFGSSENLKAERVGAPPFMWGELGAGWERATVPVVWTASGENKLKAGSRLLVSSFPEIKFILSCCGVL